eukprot:m.328368 g.328368  ORF g.328368 m.328368 type:complete len:80 (-) comp19752_c1_seq25:107-346(-)
MCYALTHKYNFPLESIRVINEDQADPRLRPTRDNIIAGLHWLMRGVRAGDVLFFHYSGHGSQVHENALCELSVFCFFFF